MNDSKSDPNPLWDLIQGILCRHRPSPFGWKEFERDTMKNPQDLVGS